MSINVNQVSVESLQLSLQAYKITLATQVARTKQAEEMVTTLMLEKISKEEMFTQILDKLIAHTTANGLDQATQYKGLLEVTLIAITELQKTDPNPTLVEIIKALTMATADSRHGSK